MIPNGYCDGNRAILMLLAVPEIVGHFSCWLAKDIAFVSRETSSLVKTRPYPRVRHIQLDIMTEHYCLRQNDMPIGSTTNQSWYKPFPNGVLYYCFTHSDTYPAVHCSDQPPLGGTLEQRPAAAARGSSYPTGWRVGRWIFEIRAENPLGI